MIRQIASLAVGIATVYLLWGVEARAATLDVCPSGCSYATIQGAVTAAAAGDTITIAAGTYTLTAQILINKPLTIIGAGEDQTIIDGGLANTHGTASDGMIRVHTSREGLINLSGFTVQNFSRKNASGIRVGIMVRSNATSAFPTTYPVNLSHVKANGSATVDSATDIGIYAAGIATYPEPTISLDSITVSGTRGNGLLFEDWRNDITVTNSELHEGPLGSTSLFIGHGTPADGPNTGTITLSNNVLVGRGIAISQTAPGRVNGGWSNIEITNNHITGLDNTDAGIAIQAPAAAGIGQNISNILIDGNEIQGVGYSPSDATHFTYGIRLTGAIDTAMVRNNDIIGANAALRVADNASGLPANITVTQNRLAANEIGIENLSTTQVRAPANWWGCSVDPHDNTPACSTLHETPGLVQTDTWVVRTADLPSFVEPGKTYTIPIHLTTLNTGATATLPPSDKSPHSFTITIPSDASDGLLEIATDSIPLDLHTWLGESFTVQVRTDDGDNGDGGTDENTDNGSGGTTDPPTNDKDDSHANGISPPGAPDTGFFRDLTVSTKLHTFIIVEAVLLAAAGFCGYRFMRSGTA